MPRCKPKKRDARGSSSAWSKPLRCESLAVEPEHIPFQKQLDQEKGLGDVEYDTKTGAPVFHSPGRYADYQKAYGYHQRGKIAGKQISHPLSGWLLQRIMDRFKEESNG